MNLNLKDRVAIVTGAGRGIGRMIALTLAEEGAKVVVNDFYENRAKAVADEIKAAGGQAMGVKADVTNSEEVTAMVKKTVDEWGTVHILCNNAGLPAEPQSEGGGFFVETTRADWDPIINLNIYGNLNCSRAVLDYMINQKYGKIISTISDAGRVGEQRLTVYGGAKAWIVAFSKSLAKEVGRYCINVNCIAPGLTEIVKTDPSAKMTDSPLRPWEQPQRQQAVFRVYPLARGHQRLGRPSDIANAVTFLVSDRAEWITGQVLSVDGGYCMVD